MAEKGHDVTDRTPAILVLADGRTFRGYGFGATGTTLGEAVFTTAMTGYQETMTDPSYHRILAILVGMTRIMSPTATAFGLLASLSATSPSAYPTGAQSAA